MNPESPFQLSVALSNWRMELEAEPGLTSESRRELEVHLRDSVAELRARGLKEEEAFWLARRRVGRPSELATEFCKTDPRVLARQQALWVGAGLLGLYCWGLISNIIRTLCFSDYRMASSPWPIVFNFLWVVPVAALVYLARNGTERWWWPRTRRQFIGVAIPGLGALQVLELAVRAYLGHPYMGFGGIWAYLLVVSGLWPATLIALIAWLMPANVPSRTKDVEGR